MIKLTLDELKDMVGYDVFTSMVSKNSLDEENLHTLWMMVERPIQLTKTPSEENNYTRERWTQTNEPELGAYLSEYWHEYAINGVVFLCGTYDDEYGYIWSSSYREWESYCY